MSAPIPLAKLDAARELHAAGHSQTYVTRAVGIAPETMRRHGIVWAVNVHTDETRDRVRELYADKGMSAGEVAKVLGLTRNVVVGLVARMGLKRTPTLRVVNSVLKRPKSAAPKKNPKPVVMVAPPAELTRVEPRPFIDRGSGCPWIVSADGEPYMACCAPVTRWAFCAEHGARAYLEPKADSKALARLLRRHL